MKLFEHCKVLPTNLAFMLIHRGFFIACNVHYTDEQPINTVQTIEKLAEILFKIVSKKALKDQFKQLYK